MQTHDFLAQHIRFDFRFNNIRETYPAFMPMRDANHTMVINSDSGYRNYCFSSKFLFEIITVGVPIIGSSASHMNTSSIQSHVYVLCIRIILFLK